MELRTKIEESKLENWICSNDHWAARTFNNYISSDNIHTDLLFADAPVDNMSTKIAVFICTHPLLILGDIMDGLENKGNDPIQQAQEMTHQLQNWQNTRTSYPIVLIRSEQIVSHKEELRKLLNLKTLFESKSIERFPSEDSMKSTLEFLQVSRDHPVINKLLSVYESFPKFKVIQPFSNKPMTLLPGHTTTILERMTKARLQGNNNEAMEIYDTEIVPQIYHFNIGEMNQILYEVSICAFYLNRKELGLLCCDRLLLKPINKDVQMWQNLTYYLQQLPGNKTITIPSGKYKTSTGENYLPCNPSLFIINGKVTMNVRLTNYTSDGVNFILRSNDGKNRSRNEISTGCLNSEGLSVYTRRELIYSEDTKTDKKYDTKYEGLEDIRLIDQTSFLCTYSAFNKDSRGEVCYGEYGQDGDIHMLKPLRISDRVEKNWLPFSAKEGGFFIIYEYQPWTILYVDRKDLKLNTIIKETIPGLDLSNFRGSAAPIKLEGGWLGLIHSQRKYSGGYLYYHRWIWLDEQMQLNMMSTPFKLGTIDQRVEMALGICLVGKDNLVVSMGLNYCQAVIKYFILKKILETLLPLDSFRI
jgi:hypothetical protein